MSLHREPTLEKQLPVIYKGVLETDELMATENQMFKDFLGQIDRLWANQFILTADVDGIQKFEDILKIVAAPATEDLEFRRARVLNRWSLTPPYTMPFLRQKLNEIMGEGNWDYELDFNSRTLIVNSEINDPRWATEIAITIAQIKPANLVFGTRPKTESHYLVSEDARTGVREWRYVLGSWNLDEYPFSTFEGGSLVKGREVPSILDALLNRLAVATIADVKGVRVNGTYIVDHFNVASATANTAVFEYAVPSSAALGFITKIELIDENQTPLTESPAYVDATFDVIIQQTVYFDEGV